MARAVFENAKRYKYIMYRDSRNVRCIVCISHYAGKPVRGIAKCDPVDPYDEEYGKHLAKARCDQKVAEKRAQRARMKFAKAQQRRMQAQHEEDRMLCYMNELELALSDIKYYVKNLEQNFEQGPTN